MIVARKFSLPSVHGIDAIVELDIGNPVLDRFEDESRLVVGLVCLSIPHASLSE